jgi:hypothetical protein
MFKKMRYEGVLPHNIDGDYENPIIGQYWQWKGTQHALDVLHYALRWSQEDLFHMLKP